MTKYIVKPCYNGKDKKTFDDPKKAINYYQDYVNGLSAKMIGSIDDKLEEMQWIGKLEVIDD